MIRSFLPLSISFSLQVIPFPCRPYRAGSPPTRGRSPTPLRPPHSISPRLRSDPQFPQP
uniref:Uncharacterized protein n=1 Tax=Arundo donax TaxID=35708 RepID=A0A0A9EBU0_ARUDO